MNSLDHRLYSSFLTLTLAASASAQVDVAICAAASSSTTACQFTEVQAKLVASGLFNTVDVINAAAATPSLQQLQQYDAVAVWSNTSFQDPVALGDVLADYVDAGGGVLVAVFATSLGTQGFALQGRWPTGYEVILSGSGSTTGNATLGNVLLPTHPIMNGVQTFDGGSSSFRPTQTVLAPGAIAIAEWSDGRILVAEGANPKRVDLGFYMPSTDCYSHFWVASTDGDTLYSNALHHVATVQSCGATVYCTPGTASGGCVPLMSFSGNPSVAASSGFTLSCDDLPGQRTGLVFYGTSGAQAILWGVGGSSFLCVKPPTQRTPAQGSGGTVNVCDGTLSLDLLAFLAANPSAVGQPIGAGQSLFAQTWYRDPPAVKTTNLSDAVQVVLCP